MVIYIFILLTVLILFPTIFRYFNYYRLALRLPYAKGLPLIGHALDLWIDKNELLNKMMEIFNGERNKKTIREKGTIAVWIGPITIVLIHELEDIEQILTSRDLTSKAFQYKFFEPWLGKGLLTSSGKLKELMTLFQKNNPCQKYIESSHWARHRKIITPAFHFKILENFLPIINSNIDIYLGKLDEKVDTGSFNIESYVANLSLDNIAETAMRAKMNAQIGGSDYCKTLKEVTETILLRIFRLLYYSDIIFNISSLGRKQKQNLTFINNYTANIIKNRKEEWNIAQMNKNDELKTDIGEKERVGLLDLLLETQRKLPDFTNQEIIDEVTTFMFGGHETVTSGINFTLYQLSRHPKIQDEVLKEVESVVGEGKFTMSNLQQLNYLERVIKETLRILPIVPFIARTSKEDIKLKSGCVLPAGCTMLIFIYAHHRNPDLFPDPERFDPDRFLAENCRERSPYAYLPFSAGHRNCIGQKFALLEMKAIIAATVRRYKILPSEDIKPVIHIILRSANGINLILEKRSPQNASEDLKLSQQYKKNL